MKPTSPQQLGGATTAPPAGATSESGARLAVEPIDLAEAWTGVRGDLPTGNVVLVASRYHQQACDAMLRGAHATLTQHGFHPSSIRIVRVPGAWELPLAVQAALGRGDTIGAIAIGVVIRGETSHDQHINRAVSLELMRLSSSHAKPVALGLLTCNTPQQVADRTGGSLGNKGDEAAAALVEMLRLIPAIVGSPPK